jgi:hypothetical protein
MSEIILTSVLVQMTEVVDCLSTGIYMFCQIKRENEKGNKGVCSHASKGCAKNSIRIKCADTSAFGDVSLHGVFLNTLL